MLWADPEHVDDRHGGIEEAFFRRYLRTGDVVVDVGANVGFTTVLASKLVGPDGKVYAIEAHPRIYTYLKGNISFNRARNISAFNVAIGNVREMAMISDISSDDQNAISADGAGLMIPMRRLDECEIGDPHIALLKIDVEGFEYSVLLGATEVLRHVECVYFEFLPEQQTKYQFTLSNIVELLSQQGFDVLRPEGDEIVRPISIDAAQHIPDAMLGRVNLMAVRNRERFLARTAFTIALDASLTGSPKSGPSGYERIEGL